MAKYSRYKQTADGITKAAIEAMTEMAEEYTGGKWNWCEIAPWKAYEYIYTVAIGQKLAGPEARGVYFEHNIPQLLEAAKTGRGKTKKAKKTICDIAIKDGKDGLPRMCIEVKTNFGKVSGDVNWCRRAVGGMGKNKLRDAAVLFFSYARDKNKETMRENFEQWRDKRTKDHERIFGLSKGNRVATNFNKIKLHEYEYGGKRWCWYVGAIQMSYPDN